MRINDDFHRPASAHVEAMDWVASPMPGVERKMLDRIGNEVARATSIVRYAPESSFSEHTHSGGEEFIVLEGTFQDEHGDYPEGTYVRNPKGTHHVPRSDDGCTIFVKLWQFAEDDRKQFALNLADAVLEPLADAPGIARAEIHRHRNEIVAVEQWAPGTTHEIAAVGGAELLILEGGILWEGQSYSRHDWIRLPPGSTSRAASDSSGARFWIKTGHLADIKLPQT